jgi:hypothetical protein
LTFSAWRHLTRISEPFGSGGAFEPVDELAEPGCADAARFISVGEISMFENLCEFL